MAQLKVSAAAIAHIRAMIKVEELVRPIVVVGWNSGSADLKRGSAGEVQWERGAPGWLVSILDVSELEAWDLPVIELHGLNFSFFGRSGDPSLEEHSLEFEAGELLVKPAAI